jgi:hypothetical protein
MIAPLHWGLGHATRCIPIINELIKQDVEICIASDGDALALLKREFPTLQTVELPAYNIRYPYENMLLSIGLQLPKIIRGAVAEHRFLKKYLETNDLDILISDNRFGLFNKKIKTVFITHQLNIQIPYKWLENLVYHVNQYYIQKFDECWVPDFETTPNLSGILSHFNTLPSKTYYIAPLSRMQYFERPIQYQITFVLSGPEPQRTIFENIICNALRQEKYYSDKVKFCLIRGVVSARSELLNLPPNVVVYPYLTSNDLNIKIIESQLIVCRSGYSSIMDLWATRSKAVLVPTPGQTEQIYLANYLGASNTRRFYKQIQADFNLDEAIAIANNANEQVYQGCQPVSTQLLAQRIQHLI